MQTHIHTQTIRQQLDTAQNSPISNELQTRLEWFVDFIEHGTVSTTCARYKIARTTFYRWLERLEQETTPIKEHTEMPASSTEQVLQKRISQLVIISALLLGVCIGMFLSNVQPVSQSGVQASVSQNTITSFPSPCYDE